MSNPVLASFSEPFVLLEEEKSFVKVVKERAIGVAQENLIAVTTELSGSLYYFINWLKKQIYKNQSCWASKNVSVRITVQLVLFLGSVYG